MNTLSEICIRLDLIAEQTLKAGERGAVHLVRHKDSRRRYILREFAGKGDVYRKLLDLSCPHLPKIELVEEIDGRVLVLEEYIQGDTLASLLRASPLSADQARPLFLQLCRAVQILHEKGIVHRDIKPENIMIRGNEAVLIDFDASREFKQAQSADTRVMGTAGYAAPEQYGFAQTDARSDIYALGVLLNVMLTGEHPARKLADGPLLPVITRCIEVNADRRYATAQELRRAVEALPAKGRLRLLPALLALALLLGILFAALRPSDAPPDDAADSGIAAGTTDTSDLLLPLQEEVWSGPMGDDGIPITGPPMSFLYDLDGDGTNEAYLFGMSLHRGGPGQTLITDDYVGTDNNTLCRTPVPGVWQRLADGTTLYRPEFAALLRDAETKVYRATNLDAPAPLITPCESEWPGGLEVTYTTEHVGCWVYEITATLGDLSLRSVSQTILHYPD